MKEHTQNQNIAPCKFTCATLHVEKHCWKHGKRSHNNQFLQPMKIPWLQYVPYDFQHSHLLHIWFYKSIYNDQACVP